MTEPTPGVNPQAVRTGRLAFILGMVVIAISAVQQVVNRFVPHIMNELALGTAEIGIAFSLGSIVVGLVGLVALIFGASALARRGPDAAIGGVGFGIGLITVVNVFVGFLAFPLTSLFLG